jgi:glutathione S-transferase
MLKIYGVEFSNNVNKVRFVANALGLDYELIKIDVLKGEQRSQEYLKINPVGKVPAIDDQGFLLFESSAISKYLADKHNSFYYPRDLERRAIIDQWIDFSNIHVQTALGRVFFNRVVAPSQGLEVDGRSASYGTKLLESYLPVIDAQLAKHGFLAGGEISLADLNLLSILDPAEVSGVELSRYQYLYKWVNKLRQQDFYTMCHSDYKEALAKIG